MKNTTPKKTTTSTSNMTPVIEEMHAMLTELLAKQRLTIQEESDRLAFEKTDAGKAEKAEKEWKAFVFEENQRRAIEQYKILNVRAAPVASQPQAKFNPKRWWLSLLDW